MHLTLHRTCLAASVAIALGFSPLSARKGPPGGGHEGCPGPGAGHEACIDWKKLDLSEEQEEKLKALHEARKEMRESHVNQVKEVRDKIREELLKEEPDRAALDKHAEELGTLHTTMSKKRFDHLFELKKILTPEQFTTLLSKPGRHECRHKMRGKGRRRRKGK